MSVKPLETPTASARYDEEHNVVWITYRGLLDAESTASVYHWLADFFDAIDNKEIDGEVFDFREVQTFGPDNLFEARKKSRGFNLKQDVSTLPVAMICANFYQEEILRGPMQNVPENNRKMIVKTEAEAIEFIANWHREQLSE
jgi:hypothetical protein